MDSPLYDHELDGVPAGTQAVANGAEYQLSDEWEPASRPLGFLFRFYKHYFLFMVSWTFGPFLQLIAAFAPKSFAARFLNRPETSVKAGTFLWKNYLRLIMVVALAFWQIPIAALAPRAFRYRSLNQWAGVSLFVLCGFFLVVALASASDVITAVFAWPYLGIVYFLGLCWLAVDYVKQARERFRQFQSSAEGKREPAFTRMLVALGFQGGQIPPTLRVLVVWGLIFGVSGSIMPPRADPGAGDQGNKVVVIGDGTVHGVIAHIAGGPFSDGEDGSTEGSYSSGGEMTRSAGPRLWVHFMRWGIVSGENLTAEMKGRGIAFQGEPALLSWQLVIVAYQLMAALLVVAWVMMAKGRHIGLVLYLTLVSVFVVIKILITAWVPESAALEDSIASLLVIAATVAILFQTEVRAYLGSGNGGAVLDKAAKGAELQELAV